MIWESGNQSPYAVAAARKQLEVVNHSALVYVARQWTPCLVNMTPVLDEREEVRIVFDDFEIPQTANLHSRNINRAWSQLLLLKMLDISHLKDGPGCRYHNFRRAREVAELPR